MNGFSVFAQKPLNTTKVDHSLILSIVLLLGLGLVTLYVSSSNYAMRMFDDDLYFVKRQLVFIFVSIIFAVICAWVNLDIIRKLLPVIVIGTFILCLLPFFPVIGVERNGASRWIQFPGGLTFQPSELAKIAVILFLANLFDKKQEKLNDPMATILPAAIGIFAFVMIVFLQSDFSTALFILILGFAILFVAGIKLYWFAIFAIFALPASFLFIFTEEYRVNRLIAFLRPEYDINGANYQVTMSKKAISDGGLIGKGMTGVDAVQGIPEVQADFVFAGWAEGMGFFGVLIYIVILGFFSWKAFQIALTCKNKFRSILAFGSALIIAMQSLTNCAVVSGAFPATGIPLPFFSAGGSSIFLTLCLCGFLLNVSRYKEEQIDEVIL